MRYPRRTIIASVDQIDSTPQSHSRRASQVLRQRVALALAPYIDRVQTDDFEPAFSVGDGLFAPENQRGVACHVSHPLP